LLGERFSTVCLFRVSDLKFSIGTVRGLKNQFLEKSDHLTENFQNFAIKGFIGTWIYIFLINFMETDKVEVTKPVRDIHHKKCWYLTSFSAAPRAISPKFLQDHSFPIPNPSAKFSPNPSSFARDISKNVSQTHYNISAPTMKLTKSNALVTD